MPPDPLPGSDTLTETELDQLDEPTFDAMQDTPGPAAGGNTTGNCGIAIGIMIGL